MGLSGTISEVSEFTATVPRQAAGTPVLAADVIASVQALANRTLYLRGSNAEVLLAGQVNIGWENPRIRIPTQTANLVLSMTHGSTPPNGARVRFTRTQVDPDWTVTIERQTDFAVLCVMPIITSAPNDGEQSWVEVEWTGAKWQLSAWSNNITDILDEA